RPGGAAEGVAADARPCRPAAGAAAVRGPRSAPARRPGRALRTRPRRAGQRRRGQEDAGRGPQHPHAVRGPTRQPDGRGAARLPEAARRGGATVSAAVVGRLAPSPTGAQHVGNARTYLIAWLSARSRGGSVALRVEDIDSPRVKAGAAEQAAA